MNILKNIIEKKGYAIGSWINTASTVVAEIMAASGFDFLTIDCEHSAVDIEKTCQILQAIKSGNVHCTPLVRLMGNSYSDNKRYLDIGAMGVIAPLIKTKEETMKLIESAKYPPIGERGVGYCRAKGYGFSFDSYISSANEDTFVCVQIEHIDSVDNIEEIFNVEGVDAAFIGPYDLSASIGKTAQFKNDEYMSVEKRILDKCREYKIIPGIHVVNPDPEEFAKRVRDGFELIAYSLDITMLGTSCRNGIDKINQLLK